MIARPLVARLVPGVLSALVAGLAWTVVVAPDFAALPATDTAAAVVLDLVWEWLLRSLRTLRSDSF